MNVFSPAGFAVVKLATDRKSGEEFAVKIMALPEPNAKAGDNENTRCTPHESLVLMAVSSSAYTCCSSQSSIWWYLCNPSQPEPRNAQHQLLCKDRSLANGLHIPSIPQTGRAHYLSHSYHQHHCDNCPMHQLHHHCWEHHDSIVVNITAGW